MRARAADALRRLRSRLPRKGEQRIVIRELPAGFQIVTQERGYLFWGTLKAAAPDKSFEDVVLRLADLALMINKRRGIAPGRKHRRRFAKAVLQRTGP